MTEWSASEQRHCAVNLTLSLNYNINLQLSRGIYIEQRVSSSKLYFMSFMLH